MRHLFILVILSGTAMAQDSVPKADQDSTGKAFQEVERNAVVDPDVLHASPAGIARGRAEADAELKAGKVRIWSYGLRSDIFVESIDRETGLYYLSLGCSIDSDIVGRVQGHNARVEEYIRDHGLPKNSFKPWEKELFELQAYFEGRSRKTAPIRLIPGGPAATSPDGAYSVRLVSHPGKTIEGKPTEGISIVVGDRDTDGTRTYLWTKDPELVWGPEGSWFAVLRGRSSSCDARIYEALDLRAVRSMRVEFFELESKDGTGLPKKRNPYEPVPIRIPRRRGPYKDLDIPGLK